MALTVQNLACVRGGRRVFAGLSLSVDPGQALVLRGANGSGKSTLLRLIAGLLQPEQGTIRLDRVNKERPVGEQDERPVGEFCHYCGHADALKTSLTVGENLAFWADYYGGGEVGRALEAMNLTHLAEIPAGLLSAGQRRRLGLARLALTHRPVWLLDEPAVSLDAASQVLLENLMARHVEAGGIVLAATHTPLALAGAAEFHIGAAGQGGHP